MPDCVLAIETSTTLGRVAVWKQGAQAFAAEFKSERSHNSQLFGPLGEALEICGGALDLIVTGTGPGSYTGVRIGIAAAQGLAWSHGVPVIGLPSVLAPDVEVLPTEFVVCGDARRGQYYAVKVSQAGQVQQPIPLLSTGEILDLRNQEPKLDWFTFDDRVPAGLLAVTLCKPSAIRLAQAAASMGEAELEAASQALLEPVYLSAPFITQAKDKKKGP